MERVRGSPGELFDLGMPARARRVVRVLEVTRPAVVLGSTQPDASVDAVRAARAGVEVVRRRSGGGAVLLEPGRVVWVDVAVPAGDPQWDADVGRAFHWLGVAWAAALGSLGMAAVAHRGPLVRTDWSPLVCFAGLGPGEVTVGGRKVVGLAQRRTRDAALFQCAALLAWDPGPLLEVLALDDAGRARGRAELAGAAAGLARDAAEVVGALCTVLDLPS